MPAIFIHGYTKDGETALLLCLLKFNEPWDLFFAWPTPSSPEIQQNHFAAIFRQLHGLARGIVQREIRRHSAATGFHVGIVGSGDRCSSQKQLAYSSRLYHACRDATLRKCASYREGHD